MDSSNYRHRVLHKLAEELELPKLTFQVIRRTIVTLGKTKGHVKDIQGMMRHSKASTTTDVYMQSLEPELRTAINSIYAEMGPAPQKPAAASANSRGNGAGTAAPERGKTMAAKPARGVVLEFATRMRQGRGKEVALNA